MSSSPRAEQVAIVGAGLGGLATAIRLAVAGQRVTLVEGQAQIGGKLNRWQAGGFSFDTGPSLLTLPGLIDELFALASQRRTDHLTLVPLSPAHRYYWPDGASLDVSSRLDEVVAGLARLAPADVPAFFRFLAQAADLYATAAQPFLHAAPDDLPALLAAAAHAPGFRWRSLPAVADPRSLHQRVASYFRDPRLIQLFDRYATYNGSSPYRTPGVMALIPYLEFAHGAWYIQGGLYRLAEQLAAVATGLGVHLITGQPVTSITIDAGRAVGLALADGTRLSADRVVVNVDVQTAQRTLLGRPGPPPTTRPADQSTSAFLLLLGLTRQYPQLAHHTIFFSADYRREFDDLFARRRPPADPTIYVCASTRTDPSQAPPGHENLFVMVNVPALEADHDWGTWAAPYRDQILTTLERRGLDGLRSAIVVERCIAPPELASATGAHRGALYGLASHGPLSLFQRPRNRDERVAGLYYVGGTTHPGGGIPLVLLSAALVTGLIAADQRRGR